MKNETRELIFTHERIFCQKNEPMTWRQKMCGRELVIKHDLFDQAKLTDFSTVVMSLLDG